MAKEVLTQDMPMQNVCTYVDQLAAFYETAKEVNACAPPPQYLRRNWDQSAQQTVAIISPHPDDECIVGGWPLRLGTEAGWHVVNIAVTHGSKPERQLPRAAELRAACNYLGFECRFLAERGLTDINLTSKTAHPIVWQKNVAALAQELDALRPSLILCPHAGDAQAAHVGTHTLTLDALATLPTDYTPMLALTEYWSTIKTPNVMLALSAPQVSQLVSGLLHHAGEVARNPYHLSLPSWMHDGVRRGAERVGLPGGPAPDFKFATLYQLMHWREGALSLALHAGVFISPSDDPSALFR
jgi:N-acetylglucosamine malate deacetylase 1